MDEKEAKFFATLLVAACIVTVILIFFVITIVRYHYRLMMMYKEKIAVEINAFEKERYRIAADLHDQLGPILATVKLQASVLEPNGDHDAMVLATLQKNIDGIVTDIRMIANNLRPHILQQHGLYKALDVLVATVNEVGALAVTLVNKGSQQPLHAQTELHVYRILQEILANALKHSAAKHVTMTLYRHSLQLLLTVTDDGRGFDTTAVMQGNKGLGLRNIVNRVELLKGDIEIASSAGCGTTYNIQLPIRDDYGQDKSSDSR